MMMKNIDSYSNLALVPNQSLADGTYSPKYSCTKYYIYLLARHKKAASMVVRAFIQKRSYMPYDYYYYVKTLTTYFGHLEYFGGKIES